MNRCAKILIRPDLRACFLAVALAVTFLVASTIYAGVPFYVQHNLVSDGFIPADHMDPNLVNPWGIAFNPWSFSFVWVANNGTGVVTIYDGLGNKQPLEVTIPGGSPTGIVFSDSLTDFVVTQGASSGPARFILASEGGFITAWSPNFASITSAVQVVDNSASGAVYKGLALAADGTRLLLYATDFHNNKIDVFDSNFSPVTLAGGFSDSKIPSGYAPFGICNLNGNLYVTYAKQDQARHDDVPGEGHGFVNVFNANGNLLRRLASRDHLNSPWGLAIAPADFGHFSNHLLIGNFGDGTINAYDIEKGNFKGQLRQAKGKMLAIDGLWSISFGNGLQNQPTNVLFFSAGPDHENHGLYGTITPEP